MLQSRGMKKTKGYRCRVNGRQLRWDLRKNYLSENWRQEFPHQLVEQYLSKYRVLWSRLMGLVQIGLFDVNMVCDVFRLVLRSISHMLPSKM